MIDAAAQAKSTGTPVPVVAATDPENLVTANPNGTFTRTMSAAPERIQQGGSWAPLDATLRQNPDGTWSGAATTSSVTLSNGGAAGSVLVSLNDAGNQLAFTWPTALPTPAVTGNTALYQGILPGVDLKVIANEQGGFSDLVIVNTAAAATNPALTSLTMGTNASTGLIVATDAAGNIAATNSSGQLVYTAPPPVMYDNSATTPTPAPAPTATTAAPTPTPTQSASSTATPTPTMSDSTAGTPTPSASATSAAPSPAASSTATTTQALFLRTAAAPADTSQPDTSATAATTSDPLVPDAGDKVARVAIKATATGLTLTPDKAMLDSPGTVFPLVIDPSIQPVWISHDTGVNNYDELQEACPTAKNWNTTSPYEANGLGAGYQGFTGCVGGAERALYEFNVGAWIIPADINSATLNINETYIAWDSCVSNPASTSQVTAWSTGRMNADTTWGNFNTQGTQLDAREVPGANRAGCAGDYPTQFNVLNGVRNTTDGFVTLELRGHETSGYINYFKRFAKTAKLSITYNTMPNVPQSPSTTPVPVAPNSTCATSSTTAGWVPVGGSGGYVTLGATVSDGDTQWNSAQLQQGQFTLNDVTSSSTLIAKGDDTNPAPNGGNLASTDDDGWVSSNTAIHKRVPTTDLVNGHTYAWSVYGWDGDLYSTSPSTTCYFSYDTAAPTAMTVNGTSLTGGQCATGGILTQGQLSTLTFKAVDSGSGMAHFGYAWQDSSALAGDGGTQVTASAATGVTASAGLTFTPSSWGAYTLWVSATDKAGNQNGAGCYTFNVSASSTATVTPGDVTGDAHPDILAADAGGNLLAWPTNSINGTAVLDSDSSNGPDADGTWKGALVTHRLPIVQPFQPAYVVDDLWALSADHTTLYRYINLLNNHGAVTGPYFSTQKRAAVPPCDGSDPTGASCNGHPANWGAVNQILSVGDMNNDTFPDLVTEETGGQIWFFPGTGNGGFGIPQKINTTAIPDTTTLIAPGNTTGDQGTAQLWARTSTGTLYAWTVTAPSGGTPVLGATTTQIGTDFPTVGYPQILSLGDLNNDGTVDLAATTSNGALVELANTRTNNAPQFNATSDATHPGPGQIQPPGWATSPTTLDSNPQPRGNYDFAGTADWNGDKLSDIISRDANGDLWLNPGNTNHNLATPRTKLGNGWGGYTFAGIANFNGSPYPDLIAEDPSGNLMMYPGDANHDLSTPPVTIGHGWGSLTIAGIGNFNNDTYPDVIARDTTGNLWMYPGDANHDLTTARAPLGHGWGSLTFAGIADWNQDGVSDILALDTSGNLLLYTGTGSSALNAGTTIGHGWSNLTIVGITDWNHDTPQNTNQDVLARTPDGTLWLYHTKAASFDTTTRLGAGW